MPFNVTPQPQQPENLGSLSQGIHTSPNTALGTLFSNLSDTLTAGVKEADRNVQKNIENDAYKMTDQVDNEFGIVDQTTLDSGPTEKSPAEIESAAKNLQAITDSYSQGNMPAKHYWGRMNTVVRELRSKYPGYRDQIDQIVSGITGQKPANALRQALFSEANSNAENASKEETLINSLMQKGMLPPDYFEQPGKYSFNDVRSYALGLARDNAAREKATTDLAIKKAQGQDIQDEAKKQFREHSTGFVQHILQSTTGPASQDWSNLQKELLDSQNAMSQGGTVSADTLNLMKGQLNRLMTQTNLALHDMSAQSWDGKPEHSYLAVLDPKDRDAAIQEAMTPFTVAMQALDAKNPAGILGALGSWIQATKDDATRDLFKNLPFTPTMAAANEQMGPQLAQTWWMGTTTGSKALSAYTTANANYFAAKMALGQGTAADDIARTAANNGKPEDFGALADQWKNRVQTLQQFPEMVQKNAVNFMFGDSSHQIIAQTFDPASQLYWLNQVASPGITNIMKERGKTDSDSWKTYQLWVAKEFQRQFLNSVKDVNEAFADPDHWDIKWNAGTSQFDIKPKFMGQTGVLANLNALGSPQKAAIAALNQEIQIVKPVLEANGKADMSMEIGQLLHDMGFDPNQPRKQGMGDALLEKVIQNLGRDPWASAPKKETKE